MRNERIAKTTQVGSHLTVETSTDPSDDAVRRFNRTIRLRSETKLVSGMFEKRHRKRAERAFARVG